MVRSSSALSCGAAALLVSLVVPSARAGGPPVYGYTGTDVTDLWSNPANWADGVVPTSAPDALLYVPHDTKGVNDLVGLEVGTVLLGDFLDPVVSVPGIDIAGNQIGVRTELALSGQSGLTLPGTRVRSLPLKLADGARVRGTPASLTTQLAPFLALDFDAVNTAPATITGSGTLDLVGNVALGNTLAWTGTVRTEAGATVSINNSRPSDPAPSSVVVRGRLEASNLRVAPGGAVDLRDGVLDASAFFNTLGAGYTFGSVRVGGDLLLGDWAAGGINAFFNQAQAPYPASYYFDQLDVTGRLDLTVADLVNASATYFEDDDSGPLTLPAQIVMASYGERLGTLPDATLPVSIRAGASPGGTGGTVLASADYRIIYTSGELDGPGQILAVLPEPGTLLALASVATLALRRGPVCESRPRRRA